MKGEGEGVGQSLGLVILGCFDELAREIFTCADVRCVCSTISSCVSH